MAISAMEKIQQSRETGNAGGEEKLVYIRWLWRAFLGVSHAAAGGRAFKTEKATGAQAPRQACVGCD